MRRLTSQADYEDDEEDTGGAGYEDDNEYTGGRRGSEQG